jgi:hypothetical protein
MDDFVARPVSPAEFDSALTRWVSVAWADRLDSNPQWSVMTVP